LSRLKRSQTCSWVIDMTQIATENKMQLGQLLLARNIITDEQIEQALQEQREKGHRKLLGELLVEMGYCTENQIASALAEALMLRLLLRYVTQKRLSCFQEIFLKNISFCHFLKSMMY
jgi:hypothetical protein